MSKSPPGAVPACARTGTPTTVWAAILYGRLRAAWMSVSAARRASGIICVVLDEADSAAAPPKTTALPTKADWVREHGLERRC